MDLFRRSAVQKTLSPDQLDQLISITNPRDWIALIGICLILAGLIIWGIFGKITIEAQGSGIIIRPGGYLVIQTPVEGLIEKITPFKDDAPIQAGQVVAEIANSALLSKIASTQLYLAELINDQKKSPPSVAKKLQSKIIEARTQLDALQAEHAVTFKVVSPYSGNFLAARATVGNYIKRGDSILSMENKGILTAVIFLPPDVTDVNTIRPGMSAKIFLGKKINAEYGYVIGRVRAVSKFPASPEVLTNLLNNMELVNYFSAQGPPYVVYIDLVKDPNTTSGYQWSSASGKTIDIKSGTLCSTLIELKSAPPIELAIPGLRK